MPYDLPFKPSVAFQSFDSTLAGVTYSFRAQWVAVENAWFMDIATVDGAPIATAVKIALGAVIGSRLMQRVPGAPLGYFYIIDTSGKGQDAGYDDLGARVIVRFYHLMEAIFSLVYGIPIP